ncbi:hypothetical protein ACOSQ2_006103 [Xanthoceras sorbifolium]
MSATHNNFIRLTRRRAFVMASTEYPHVGAIRYYNSRRNIIKSWDMWRYSPPEIKDIEIERDNTREEKKKHNRELLQRQRFWSKNFIFSSNSLSG